MKLVCIQFETEKVSSPKKFQIFSNILNCEAEGAPGICQKMEDRQRISDWKSLMIQKLKITNK